MGNRVIQIAMIMLGTSGQAFDRAPNIPAAFEIHECIKNPFLRAVGVFGGPQRELFLQGPHLRMEGSPPQAGRTRVIDVTGRLTPIAEPEIDKCGSWLEWSDHDDLVILTVLWDDRNCRTLGRGDDPIDCRGRARLGFSLAELGIEDLPATRQERRAFNERLAQEFVVEVYFARQTGRRERHLETGMWKEAPAAIHLVARMVPLSSRPSVE